MFLVCPQLLERYCTHCAPLVLSHSQSRDPSVFLVGSPLLFLLHLSDIILTLQPAKSSAVPKFLLVERSKITDPHEQHPVPRNAYATDIDIPQVPRITQTQ